MKPILLIQSRPESDVSDAEYEAICRFGGLAPEQVERLRAETGNLPYVELIEYSAVIMPGGPGHFADPQPSDEWVRFEEWLLPLLRRVIDENVPYFGICLGMGAILTAEGTRPTFEFGEPVSSAEVTVQSAGMGDPLLADFPKTFDAIVGHTEGYNEAPYGTAVLVRNDACIEMIRVGERAYGVQFHPELDAAGLELRIHAYAHAGYFAPEQEQELAEMARGVVTTWPQEVLRRFVEKYVILSRS